MKSVNFKGPLLRAMILSTAVLVAGGVTQAFAQKYKPKAGEDWVTYKNERFGYRLYYPSAVFTAQQQEDDEESDETDDGNGDEADDVSDDTDDEKDASDNSDDSDDEDEDDAEEGDENGDTANADDNDGADTDNGNSLTLVSKDGKAKIVTFAAINNERLSPTEYRNTLLNEFGGYDQLDYQPVGKSWFVLSGYRGDTIYYQKVLFSCRKRVVNVFSINFPKADKSYYERFIEIMEDNFKTGRGTDTPKGC